MVYDQLFAVRFYSDPENKNQTFLNNNIFLDH